MMVEFTKDQAQALLGLLDIAVKSGGLRIASTALFFSQALEEAARKESIPASTAAAPVVDEGLKT